jgi:diguanylate cyclase (GGDEF)-like protein
VRSLEESIGIAWIAGGAALATSLVVILAVLALRSRRGGKAARSAVARLTEALEQAQDDAARARDDARRVEEESERAQAELRWVRRLSAVGATVELEEVLERALEAASRLAGAAAAMLVLAQGDDEPVVATFGLSVEESSRQLLGLPPEGGEARAVTMTYRYTEDEIEHDEFRLRRGLALPVGEEGGERIGTLALFWRRAEGELGDDELVRLEALTRALVPALRNAFQFEDVRRHADVDPATGLLSRRSLDEALRRECSRARRYERRLTLMLVRVGLPTTEELVTTAAERLRAAVRTSDIPCHAGDGTFAVLLPESALADAEHLYRRLQFTVGAKLDGGNGRARVLAGIAELRPDDDATSLFERADGSLARALAAQGEEASPGAAVDPAQ